jgi:hypothetical protein
MNDTQEVFMNREQWENLARFAGISCHHRSRNWLPHSTGGIATMKCADCGSVMERAWQPDNDWSDFGPLWLLLEVWLGDGTPPDQPLHSATWDFECAKMEGDERQLMETGCLLGATIGATMGDKA